MTDSWCPQDADNRPKKNGQETLSTIIVTAGLCTHYYRYHLRRPLSAKPRASCKAVVTLASVLGHQRDVHRQKQGCPYASVPADRLVVVEKNPRGIERTTSTAN